MTVTKLKQVTVKETNDQSFFELVDDCKNTLDEYFRLWKEYQDKGNSNRFAAANQASIAEARAQGLVWAVFRQFPQTLQGVMALIAIQQQLVKGVESDMLEVWPHMEGWLDRIHHCIEDICHENRRQIN